MKRFINNKIIQKSPITQMDFMKESIKSFIKYAKNNKKKINKNNKK